MPLYCHFFYTFVAELTTFIQFDDMLSKNAIHRIRRLELKKFRDQEGLFVAEGPKVVSELLDGGFEPVELYAAVDDFGRGASMVSAAEIKAVSFLQHPQGVVGVFRIPKRVLPESLPSELILALDGVQDPGNVGTIIRIADWFGIKTVLMSADCADCWGPKVVQATMGSLARVNIYSCDLPKVLSRSELPIYGTLLDGTDIYAQELAEKGIIVMGNEGKGLSAAVRNLVTQRLLVPSYSSHSAESLNVAVATAVVCSEFRRRHRCITTAS